MHEIAETWEIKKENILLCEEEHKMAFGADFIGWKTVNKKQKFRY